jgi:hypothetical protein
MKIGQLMARVTKEKIGKLYFICIVYQSRVKCYVSEGGNLPSILISVAEPEPEPQGAASFSRSRSRNATRLWLRQWYQTWIGIKK